MAGIGKDRSVAQSGSAPASGAGGREFKSPYSDQFSKSFLQGLPAKANFNLQAWQLQTRAIALDDQQDCRQLYSG
jgi:hypothetical protein